MDNSRPPRQGAARSADFYWTLFKSTFLISAFTVGGGYVIIPLLKAKYVDEYGWLSDKETLDLVAIAQSMPGVAAINAAVLLGYRMAGFWGTATALLATTLPPLITISAIAVFYAALVDNAYISAVLKGMQCGATAIIVNVGIDLLHKQIKKKLVIPLLIMAGTFIGNYWLHINIMYLVALDAVIGFLLMRDDKYN